MKDLSIIIVNYNVKEFLLNSIKSIRDASGKISTEIIVVDNASEDGSVEAVKKKFPKVKLIANKENIGFGAANNLGLEKAKGKFILFLNPDTIVNKDTFNILIKFFNDNPDAGMAGCKVLNPDGSLQLACRRGFPGPWTTLTKLTGLSTLFPKSKLFARYNLTYLDANETYEVDAISGAFMMMRKEAYENIGGFDPQFFMYGEDLDLCYRIQKAGYKVYYVHSTEIIHYKGESTKRSSIDETNVFYKAMHLFVNKHFSSSFILKIILQAAIIVRKLFAFANVYKIILTAIIVDFVINASSIFLAEYIYSTDSWIGFPEIVRPWVYLIPALMQLTISGFASAYKKNVLSILRSLGALVIGFVLLSSITFFFKQYAFSRAVLLITYSLLFISFTLWRVFVKVVFKFGVVSDSGKLRTLVVGTNSKAIDIAAKLKSSLTSLHHVVGIIGIGKMQIGKKIKSFEVLGSLDNLKKILRDRKIDKVIFSSDEIPFSQMFIVVSECQGENVEFMVAGSEMDYLVGKSSVTMMEHIPLLKVSYNISSLHSRLTKAFFDFSFSFILLFFFPFIYFASKLSKKQSRFFKFMLGVPAVFIGRKSFVGPLSDSFFQDLYLGKIGLTGLWFTELVDAADKEEIHKLNIYYARNHSIWLDLEIIGKTFANMLLRREK
ncbi:glycosyltransferase [Bacteroidota bacterium]